MIPTDFEQIEKEKMEHLTFPKKEVLSNSIEKENRERALRHALSAAGKDSLLKIYFKDGQSRKVVETPIWGMTDKRLILERSVAIPISRIYTVK